MSLAKKRVGRAILINFTKNVFPLFEATPWDDLKDPCPVHDGSRWHVFGSAGTVATETWKLFHATSAALEGPWEGQPLVELPITGSGVAAPGVIFSDGVFHMFVQTEFMRPGGRIEHAISNDGFTWVAAQTAILSNEGDEYGIYDPHPAVIRGGKYLAYSAMPKFERVPQPDVYLAKSSTDSWYGPWVRMGKILDHDDVPHHNRRDQPDYEWGIEGAQLVELPDGRILLNATCFLPNGTRGTRQRVFFAVADHVNGPYRTIGPVLEPAQTGENGHSTVILVEDELVLMYQSRVASTDQRWRYGIASTNVSAESWLTDG